MSRLDRHPTQDAPAPFTLITISSGVLLEVRPSGAMDYRKVADHLHGMSFDDRACRFLTAIKISPAVIESFLDRTEDKLTFLAVDMLPKVAGMVTIAATRQPAHAEVGVSVANCYRRQGVALALLDHVVRVAQDRGLAVLQAVTSAQNHPVHNLAARAGFRAVPYPEDRTLVLLHLGLSDQA